MTLKLAQFCDDPQKISTNSSYPPKIFIFLKTQKNIEIKNFEPQKIARAYVCVKISEYPPGGVKPSSKIFLLTVPRRYMYFFCGSFMFFLSCVVMPFVRVCLFVPCGHLLGKGWPLGSSLWCLTGSLSLSHWYPGSGVVLDYIDSWSYTISYFAY